MTTTSRLANPLLASIFIAGGLDAWRNPEGKVKAAEAVTKPLTAAIDVLPDDTATLVRVNGAVQVGAGAMLALGKFPRLAALTLMGSIIPTTYAGHRFWEEVDEGAKAQARTHFLKNLGLLGGLLLAATQPRARNRRRNRAGGGAHLSLPSSDAATASIQRASDGARHLLHQVEDAVAKDAPKVVDAAGHLFSSGAELTSTLLNRAGEYLPTS
jgi:uncharacterized membrane protein YphA (DoxX/SURF4 family)